MRIPGLCLFLSSVHHDGKGVHLPRLFLLLDSLLLGRRLYLGRLSSVDLFLEGVPALLV